MSEPIDIVLKTSGVETAFIVFHVFYNDKSVSIASFYLDTRFSGFADGNDQIESYNINGYWCWDWYWNWNFTSGADPTGPSVGSGCVLRGGSCRS